MEDADRESVVLGLHHLLAPLGTPELPGGASSVLGVQVSSSFAKKGGVKVGLTKVSRERSYSYCTGSP